MRVAVLGSRGFVGSKISQEASRRGWLVNHIGSCTQNRGQLLQESDAIVHCVGSFMPDRRYKKLVSQPVSFRSIAKLASMRLGLDPPSPLQPPGSTLEEVNYGTVRDCIGTLLANRTIASAKNASEDHFSRIPFVFVSASEWELSDPSYIASKRRAETLINSKSQLRPIILRPGLIAPPKALQCDQITPRHLVDIAMLAVNSPYRVSVDSIAIAACDAIEDSTFEGVIGCEILRELDSPSQVFN